jgi:hypothetical protein
MAWTKSDLADPPLEPALSPLLRPLEDLLVSGGDGRLGLCAPAQENIYGCTPFPRPDLIDFASSTASSISVEAYERASAARGTLLANALKTDLDSAFGAAVAATGAALLSQLKLSGTGTKIVFAPSGTDAQLHALFLARALLAKPLTTIVAGADQTGSGTAYTCTGRHFSQTTAGGWDVAKGAEIAGLGEDVRGVEIGFCKPDGAFCDAGEMDQRVLQAVDDAVAQGRGVLLQAMEASKFGWKAPSDAMLDKLAARHAGQVQIVVDACQLRISRTRLKTMLAKGWCVLITGSKFFTGPAFSGALLVPDQLSQKIAALDAAPAGLCGYSSCYDWPASWEGLRRHFPRTPNFGQWLRWEAALEEMRLYYAVPQDFRQRLKDDFQHALKAEIVRASSLTLLPAAASQPTIFGVLLNGADGPLSAAGVAAIYQILRRGDAAEKLHACQLGQPVVLPARGTAALRFSLSARMIRQCWSLDEAEAARKSAALFENLSLAVKQLDRLAQQAGQTSGSPELV